MEGLQKLEEYFHKQEVSRKAQEEMREDEDCHPEKASAFGENMVSLHEHVNTCSSFSVGHICHNRQMLSQCPLPGSLVFLL